jgi:hypothetical protein
VLIELEAEGAARPEFVRLTWIGPARSFLADERVPRSGVIPAGGGLPSVFLETALAEPEERLLLARGFVGEAPVSEGAAVLALAPGGRRTVRLALTPGQLPDGDGDGIPDAIDRCPTRPGPEVGCLPSADGAPHAGADAAPGGDGDGDAALDAGAGADAPPPALADGPGSDRPGGQAGPSDAVDGGGADAAPGDATCPPAFAPGEALWDFEDGSTTTFAFGMRAPEQKSWILVWDETPGTHKLAVEPVPERCGRRALHYSAQGFRRWGSGIASALLPPPPMMPMAPEPAPAVDASGYRGVRFSARADTPVNLLFKLADAASFASGPHPQTLVSLGREWREYAVPFADVKRADRAVSPATLQRIEFLVPAGGPHEIWIDDIAFVK